MGRRAAPGASSFPTPLAGMLTQMQEADLLISYCVTPIRKLLVIAQSGISTESTKARVHWL